MWKWAADKWQLASDCEVTVLGTTREEAPGVCVRVAQGAGGRACDPGGGRACVWPRGRACVRVHVARSSAAPSGRVWFCAFSPSVLPDQIAWKPHCFVSYLSCWDRFTSSEQAQQHTWPRSFL